MPTRKIRTTPHPDLEETIASRVDVMFREAVDSMYETRTNPVTGSRWVRGLDPIKPQKQAACRALMAREWFAVNAPPDAPPLPLSYGERESLKGGGLPHVVAWFARSLEAHNYEFCSHPSFEDYARGVMASPYAPDFIKSDQQLRGRFPPTPLNGLGPGLMWRPAKTNSCKAGPFSPRQRDGISAQNGPNSNAATTSRTMNAAGGSGTPGVSGLIQPHLKINHD